MRIKKYLTGWWMWFIATLFYSLDYFQHTAPSVLIEPISDSLHIRLVEMGNVMSLYFPIYALTQLPAGYCLDRFGIRNVLFTACFIVSIGLLSMITPLESKSILILGRILIAIGSAFAFLGALKTASAWLLPSAFSVAVGLTNTLGVLGGLMGQPILNHFILRYSWRWAIFYISFFSFLLSLFIFDRKR